MITINRLFTNIYSNYYNDVFRIAYNYTLNRHDSEDIVQQTFIKLYKNITKFYDLNDEVRNWLIRVTINESKNFMTSAWKRKNNLKEDAEFFGIEEKENTLFYDLMGLPKKYRITIYLYYFEGYSIKEIASILKTSESNIKQRLKRGKEKLKIELESDAVC